MYASQKKNDANVLPLHNKTYSCEEIVLNTSTNKMNIYNSDLLIIYNIKT